MNPGTVFKSAIALMIISIVITSSLCTIVVMSLFDKESENNDTKEVVNVKLEDNTQRAFKVENRIKVKGDYFSNGQDGTAYYLHVIEMDKDEEVVRVSTIYSLKPGKSFHDIWYACEKTNSIRLKYSLTPVNDPDKSIMCSRKFTLTPGQLNMLILKSEEEYLDEMIDELSKKKKQ